MHMQSPRVINSIFQHHFVLVWIAFLNTITSSPVNDPDQNGRPTVLGFSMRTGSGHTTDSPHYGEYITNIISSPTLRVYSLLVDKNTGSDYTYQALALEWIPEQTTSETKNYIKAVITQPIWTGLGAVPHSSSKAHPNRHIGLVTKACSVTSHRIIES